MENINKESKSAQITIVNESENFQDDACKTEGPGNEPSGMDVNFQNDLADGLQEIFQDDYTDGCQEIFQGDHTDGLQEIFQNDFADGLQEIFQDDHPDGLQKKLQNGLSCPDVPNLTMKDLPESERPYEKCEKFGAEFLSDAELIAIIIKSGSHGRKAIDIAYELLRLDQRYPGLEGIARLGGSSFRNVRGIGRVKAIELQAVCELARRLSRIRYTKGKVFSSSEAVAQYYMASMRDLLQEELHVMLLDTQNALIRECCLTKGTVNASLISPREIFICALENKASGIILAHNHPSGNVTPSEQDIESTRRVKESGRMLGIQLLDHLIIGNMNYISLLENGYM